MNATSPSGRRPAADPFDLWKQFYQTNEQTWTAAFERSMASPAFAEAQARLLETLLNAQKTVRDQTRAYLEAVNMPTREDVARLGELIVALEEKIDQVDDRLGGIELALRAAKGSRSS
jgi:polyhydroxyalkanoic acid synthase PhaR subunit